MKHDGNTMEMMKTIKMLGNDENDESNNFGEINDNR